MEAQELARQFMRERDVLFGYILGLTQDHDAAEEVIQDLAAAVLVEAQRGGHPDDFGAWVRTLARHRVADHYRREGARRRTAQAFESMADVLDRTFEENEGRAEEEQARLRHLRDCLGRLGGRARQVVDAFYRDRKPIREIAAAFALESDYVKVALSRARKALAECVTRKLASELP